MANANYNYSLTIGAQLKDTNQIKTQLDRFGESYRLKINVELKNDKLASLNRTINEATDALNRLRGATNNVNGSLQTTNQTSAQLSTHIEQATSSIQELGNRGRQNLDRLNDSQQRLNQHTRTFGDILRTVYQFYIASLPARAMETMVREAVDSIQTFDKALTEFKKVSDLSGQSLQNYTNELGELGLTVARTSAEMVEMAGNFKKAGFTEEEAKQLSVVASMYQNVADSEIDAGEAANYVTSQIRAFHLEADQAQNIIDQLNIVSNNFSVSSTDISIALSKTASAMATLGNDMSETIGLVTAGTEQLTGQASKVARGLRTIGLNISKVAQEAGKLTFEVNGVTKSISLLNEAGDTLSTFEILEKIAQDWQNMTLMERQAIGAALAGKNQYEVFASVLSNFDHAIESSEKALEAEGSALKENQAYLDSLEGHVQKLRSAYMSLIVGNGGLTQVIKTIIDLGTTILNFLNTPLGGAITKAGAIVAAIALVNTALNALVGIINTSLIGGITGLIGRLTAWAEIEFGLGTTIAQATALTYAQSQAVGVLGAYLGALGINPVVLAIMGAIAALYALKKAHDMVVRGIEEGTEKLQNSTDALKEAEDKLKEIEKDLENLKNKKLEVTDPKDLDNLEKEENYLNNQLILQKAIADEKERQLKADARALSTKTGTSIVSDATWQGGGSNFARMGDGTGTSNYIGTASDAIQKQTEDIQRLKQKYDEASVGAESYKNAAIRLGATEEQLSMTENQLKEIFGDINNATAQKILNYQEEIHKTQELSDSITQISASGAENANSIQLQIDAGIDLDGHLQQLVNDFTSVVGATQDATNASEETTDELKEQEEAISDLAEKYNVAVEDVENLIDSLESQGVTDFSEQLSQAEERLKETAQTTETLDDKYKDLLSDIDGLADAYSTLSKAVDEYNTSGQFSFETASSLLKLSPEYLALLQEENGQLSINKEAYDALVDAKIAEAKATLLLGAQEEIETIIQQDFQRQAQGTGETVKTEGENVKAGANTMHEASLIALEAGDNFAIAWDKIVNPPNSTDTTYLGLSSEAKADIADVQRRMKESFDLLGKTGTALKNVGSAATTAGNKASGAAKNTAKSTKNAADLLNEYIVYKTEQWIKKVEKKVEDYKTQLKGLERQLERVKNKYEPLIEKNKEWMSTLSSNFDIVEKIENTGNKQLNKLLKELQKVTVKYNEQKKVLEKTIDLRKEQIDDLDKQIDVYKELEDQTKDYYKELLDDLEDANDELERQIKLEQLLDALNKAKSKMVKTYVEGQGFVYTQDSAAVSKATKDLQEFERSEAQKAEKKAIENERDAILKQYEDEKKELEKQKKEFEKLNEIDEKTLNTLEREFNDTKDALNERAQQLYNEIYANNKVVEKQYKEEVKPINQKIKKLNKLIEQNQAKIDSAKKTLENYKNQTHKDFSDLSDAQKKRGNTIISHLKDIASKMAAQEKKEQQKDTQAEKEGKEKVKDAGKEGNSSGTKVAQTSEKPKTTTTSSSSGKAPTTSSSGSSKTNTTKKTTTSGGSKSTKSSSKSKKKKAYGDRYIDENGMYLVGDNPNQNELVLGSRLNGAVGVNLNQGSGVVPHTLTSTLMDMAEEYQRGNSNSVLNGTTNNNKSTSISIGNISLPSVQDGNAFVDYLQNFSLDMTQAAYSRT